MSGILCLPPPPPGVKLVNIGCLLKCNVGVWTCLMWGMGEEIVGIWSRVKEIWGRGEGIKTTQSYLPKSSPHFCKSWCPPKVLLEPSLDGVSSLAHMSFKLFLVDGLYRVLNKLKGITYFFSFPKALAC